MLGRSYEGHDLVFCHEDGTLIHPDRFTESLPRLAARAELPPLTPHGLRHTWVTLGLQAGVHAKVAQEVLGHASIAITLDTYSHVTPGMKEDTTALVADLTDGR